MLGEKRVKKCVILDEFPPCPVHPSPQTRALMSIKLLLQELETVEKRKNKNSGWQYCRKNSRLCLEDLLFVYWQIVSICHLPREKTRNVRLFVRNTNALDVFQLG